MGCTSGLVSGLVGGHSLRRVSTPRAHRRSVTPSVSARVQSIEHLEPDETTDERAPRKSGPPGILLEPRAPPALRRPAEPDGTTRTDGVYVDAKHGFAAGFAARHAAVVMRASLAGVLVILKTTATPTASIAAATANSDFREFATTAERSSAASDQGSTRTPGLRIPDGSSAALAACRTTAKPSGLWRSYQVR